MTRQTLVDSQDETGELSHGSTTAVSTRLSGTVTAMAAVGKTLTRGQTMFAIDNDPVVLLYGSLPAYRALVSGDEGADVEQFERNLSALGYDGFTVDDEYTDATADAVKEWQEDLGLEETGKLALGRVVYATTPIRVDAHEAAIGAGVGGNAAILKYTGTARVVTVDLETADQRIATKGAAVKVKLPNGKTVTGKISGTKTIVQAGEETSDESETKIEVTISLADQRALAGLDEASVTVSFTAGERKNVLTVPVSALLALSEGGYGVEVVDGSTSKVVAVKTGLFAGGRVEVSGAGLTEKTTVGMPS
ncbi:peptidoglycan-binding protein [Kribbella hippodromi]|uniref:Peptidoglycan-binding protein n=1 Tax=Kribbella hippodromi TaxID=434347 RepID=A0ABN2CIM5_9ACTN